MKSRALLKAVVWSVGLGLAMEAILLALSAASGKIPALAPVVADTVQKVSWSTIVCVGIALGQSVVRNRARIMGLLGLVAAPSAFYISKALHKGMTQALSQAIPAAAGPSPMVLALLKAAEYAALGFWIGRLTERPSAGIGAYALRGAAVGLAFGGFATAFFFMPSGAPLTSILPKAVNEILFPFGCSIVLFAANKFAAVEESA